MQAARGASLTPSRAIIATIAIAGYAADQLTKAWAVEHLADRPPVDVVGSLLRFNLTFNPGAAFSTGTQLTPVLTVIAITALLVVGYLSRRVASPLWAVGFGLLIAGIGGNLTDRLLRAPGPFRGHVVDFLQLPHWPIFNVADICINVAAGVLVLQTLRGIDLAGRREQSAAEDNA